MADIKKYFVAKSGNLFAIVVVIFMFGSIYVVHAIAESIAPNLWSARQDELIQQASQIINFDAVWYNPYRNFISAYWMVWRWAILASLLLCVVAYLLRKISVWLMFATLPVALFIPIMGGLWGAGLYMPGDSTQAVFWGKEEIAIINSSGKAAIYNRNDIIYEDYLWRIHEPKHGIRDEWINAIGSDDVYIFIMRDRRTDKELARVFFDIEVEDFYDGNKKPYLYTLPNYAIESDFEAVTQNIFKLHRLYSGPTKRIYGRGRILFFMLVKPDLRSFPVVWPTNEE